jgi:hypothetical protein
LKTYLIETGGKTWASKGENMNEGVYNAFIQIRDACYKNSDLKLDLTFTVRRDDEPKKHAIKSSTINALRLIGELKHKDVDNLNSILGEYNGT